MCMIYTICKTLNTNSRITIIGDKGYLSTSVQLDLFETSEIRLEVPYRSNQKDWQPTFPPFAKARKRVETLFSQMVDQFMLCRNYAKQQVGLFARISAKSAHLLSYNISTLLITNPLEESNMRYFNSPNGLIWFLVMN